MSTRLGGSVTLSVVVPVYNEAATIMSLIDRVRAVPLQKEIILVDDGSTDGTGGKAPRYGQDLRSPRVMSSWCRTQIWSTTRRNFQSCSHRFSMAVRTWCSVRGLPEANAIECSISG